MNGVIWSKTQKTFVPISSVPVFAMLQQERLKHSRALETHNFQLQNLTLTAFEEPRFLEFYDNDMKVRGLCGELWTLLSEQLNFTLQPIRSNESSLGASEKNQTIFPHGLLSIISRNETIAIPKVETYGVRHAVTDFTIPLWLNSQQLYIQNQIIHDSTWMTKMFSWKTWCFILVMYLLFSLGSFCSHNTYARIKNNRRRSTISDHIFYNFGMLCNQSYIPKILIGRSKILELSMGLFCSVLYMAFGALLFNYITKKVNSIPFHDIDTLRNSTSYNIVTLKGSVAHIAFKSSNIKEFVRIRPTKRVVVASTVEEMFKMACSTKKYAAIQGEDESKTRGRVACDVIPVGKSFLKMWIASGIAKNFKYKRTIDLGILRLKEVGLWKGLVKRLLRDMDHYQNDNTEAIGLDQIFLIILMLCCGMITAFIIFTLEKIVYAYKRKRMIKIVTKHFTQKKLILGPPVYNFK